MHDCRTLTKPHNHITAYKDSIQYLKTNFEEGGKVGEYQETKSSDSIIHTIGAKNKAASAILEVIITFGWYFSRQRTIGAAPM